MSSDQEIAALVEEKKSAYLEHWQNTERLVAVEKEWRMAKEQGDAQRVGVLELVVDHWREKVAQSKERAWRATIRWQEKVLINQE